MKKFLVFLVIAGGIFAVYRCAPVILSGKKAPVMRSEAKTTVDEEGNVKTAIPMAQLPEAEERKGMDVLSGKVARIVANPGDITERGITVVYAGEEPVVMANVQYVHTLEYFYMGKTVALEGKWRKDAVIYGKPYRAFWVEDIKLLEK